MGKLNADFPLWGEQSDEFGSIDFCVHGVGPQAGIVPSILTRQKALSRLSG